MGVCVQTRPCADLDARSSVVHEGVPMCALPDTGVRPHPLARPSIWDGRPGRPARLPARPPAPPPHPPPCTGPHDRTAASGWGFRVTLACLPALPLQRAPRSRGVPRRLAPRW